MRVVVLQKRATVDDQKVFLVFIQEVSKVLGQQYTKGSAHFAHNSTAYFIWVAFISVVMFISISLTTSQHPREEEIHLPENRIKDYLNQMTMQQCTTNDGFVHLYSRCWVPSAGVVCVTVHYRRATRNLRGQGSRPQKGHW